MVAMNIDLMTLLAAHPILDRLRLSHVDSRRHHTPRRSFVSVGPVDRPETWKPCLQHPHDSIARADLWPRAAVDVEAEDAAHLAFDRPDIGVAVNLAMDSPGIALGQANANRPPTFIGQKREVQVSAGCRPLRRCLMPRAYEVCGLLQRVGTKRFDHERVRLRS